MPTPQYLGLSCAGGRDARGPNKSLDRVLWLVGYLIRSDGFNGAFMHPLRTDVEPVLRKLLISHS